MVMDYLRKTKGENEVSALLYKELTSLSGNKESLKKKVPDKLVFGKKAH